MYEPAPATSSDGEGHEQHPRRARHEGDDCEDRHGGKLTKQQAPSAAAAERAHANPESVALHRRLGSRRRPNTLSAIGHQSPVEPRTLVEHHAAVDTTAAFHLYRD